MREEILLSGVWECQDAPYDVGYGDLPETFGNRIPVPGLWDMAEKPFAYTSDAETLKRGTGFLRKALWYKKEVVLPRVPGTAILKIGKGFWGKEIYVNGAFVCRHEPNFSPCYADISAFLAEGRNEIVIKTGEKGTQSAGWHLGFDCEKKKFIPGLYDDVTLILAEDFYLSRIQVAPRPDEGSVTVKIEYENHSVNDLYDGFSVDITDGGKTVAHAETEKRTIAAGEKGEILVSVPFESFLPWTPETPVLYFARAACGGDCLTARFGMREFRFDGLVPTLNGKPYYLRGTNVVLFRFFEDEKRGALPWDREWVEGLLKKFRSLHVNSLRFHVCSPPEFWYDLCDSVGILVQDEYPVFGSYECPVPFDNERMRGEFRDLIGERANHPCIAIWDAQNECADEPDRGYSVDSGSLIEAVRSLDLSSRPWDNGWGRPVDGKSPIEVHPYLYLDSGFRLSGLNSIDKDPAKTLLCPDLHRLLPLGEENPYPTNPRIVNEYSWLWLTREGKPTRLTEALYANLFPDGATERTYRDFYAYAVAALTEFWRSGRKSAAVMEFCGLSYSREGGETSDNFLPDISRPTYDPAFERRMRSAMAPVGLCVNDWSETVPSGSVRTVGVSVFNDLPDPFSSELLFTLSYGEETVCSEKRKIAVSGGESVEEFFTFGIPPRGKGFFRLKASYFTAEGEEVFSERVFRDGPALSRGLERKKDLAIGVKPVVSSVNKSINDPLCGPDHLTAGRRDRIFSPAKYYCSEPCDGQFILLDLGEERKITDVRAEWRSGCLDYGVSVSSDGKRFEEILRVKGYEYGTIAYEVSARGRFVRFDLNERLKKDEGFSLYAVSVFGE